MANYCDFLMYCKNLLIKILLLLTLFINISLSSNAQIYIELSSLYELNDSLESRFPGVNFEKLISSGDFCGENQSNYRVDILNEDEIYYVDASADTVPILSDTVLILIENGEFITTNSFSKDSVASIYIDNLSETETNKLHVSGSLKSLDTLLKHLNYFKEIDSLVIRRHQVSKNKHFKPITLVELSNLTLIGNKELVFLLNLIKTPNLLSLTLDLYDLNKLNENISKLNNLKELKLSSYQLKRIDPVYELKKLRHLDVSNSNQVIITDDITKLDSLSVITFSNKNKRKTIKNLIKLNKALEEIHLYDYRGNNHIPKILYNLKNIKKIHLHGFWLHEGKKISSTPTEEARRLKKELNKHNVDVYFLNY